MRKIVILYFGIFGVIVLAGVLSYILFFSKGSDRQQAVIPQISPLERQQSSSMGGNLYEKTNNPASQLPETNPFEVETNTFQETKTNPFEEGYKNPFE